MAFMRTIRVIACALVLCGCASRPMPTLQFPVGAQLDAVKERLFVLVEAERERLNNGAKPLILDPELMRAAQIHADDMAMKQSFDVDNPDGNAAVNALLMNPKFRGFVGENSAAQYFTPGKPIDAQSFARGFLNIWENSPDHRSNLVFPGFDRTGIGITVSGNKVYAAELFATDLGLPEPQ
jgi:uncharacterized protein YkwD